MLERNEKCRAQSSNIIIVNIYDLAFMFLLYAFFIQVKLSSIMGSGVFLSSKAHWGIIEPSQKWIQQHF